VCVCVCGVVKGFISQKQNTSPWDVMLRVIINKALSECVRVPRTRQIVHTLILNDTRGEQQWTLYAAAGHNICVQAEMRFSVFLCASAGMHVTVRHNTF